MLAGAVDRGEAQRDHARALFVPERDEMILAGELARAVVGERCDARALVDRRAALGLAVDLERRRVHHREHAALLAPRRFERAHRAMHVGVEQSAPVARGRRRGRFGMIRGEVHEHRVGCEFARERGDGVLACEVERDRAHAAAVRLRAEGKGGQRPRARSGDHLVPERREPGHRVRAEMARRACDDHLHGSSGLGNGSGLDSRASHPAPSASRGHGQ